MNDIVTVFKTITNDLYRKKELLFPISKKTIRTVLNSFEDKKPWEWEEHDFEGIFFQRLLKNFEIEEGNRLIKKWLKQGEIFLAVDKKGEIVYKIRGEL